MNHIARLVLLAFLGLLVLVNQSQTAAAQEPKGRKYALLIGVRDYDLNQLRKLPYAENDVTELAAVLTRAGYRRVELLTQTEGAKQARFLPLGKTILESLKGILEDRTPDDLVLVAFAGHGVQFRGEKEHYFCPMDAVLTDKSTLVSLTDVYSQLGKSKAGTKLLMVDACRNDPLAGNARDASEVKLESLTRPQLPIPPGGIAAMFSCLAGQQAFEHESLKHGVFFHHVLLGLKGAAKGPKQGNVSWDSLVAYVKSEVPDTAKELLGNKVRQVPESLGELRGNALLISETSPTSLKAPFDAQAAREAQSRWSAYLNVPTSRSNSVGIEMVLIPPGEYSRGFSATDVTTALQADSKLKSDYFVDEQPAHTVRISNPIYLSKTEITQSQYQLVLGRNPSAFSAVGARRDQVEGFVTRQFPIENISWYDCVEFCNKLSAAEDKSPCYELTDIHRTSDESIDRADVRHLNGAGYRLPTEAEWEYACRAGTTTPFHFGERLDGSQANVDGTYPFGIKTGGPFLGRTQNVGAYAANQFGLSDMSGNVLEWCQDCYNARAYARFTNEMAIDPIESTQSQFRVLRGGSWLSTSGNSRSSDRHKKAPGDRGNSSGFRIICHCEH